MVVALTTAVAAALGASGPALAQELPVAPLPDTTPVVPDPAALPVELPPIPAPDLDLEPIVDAQIEAGNIDVSIRVLSPGEDGTVTQEGETSVVSEGTTPDTTAEAPLTDAAADAVAPATGDTSTNVSIRVLSPGDDGDVSQIMSGSREDVAGAGPESAMPQPDPAPASAAPLGGAADSSQYQDENSRYQSSPPDDGDAWYWSWLLSIDCSGNASSTSTERGRPESSDWSWDWDWEWGCPAASDSEESTESGTRSPPSTDDDVPQPSPAASTEPWQWTWTFTFCGQTRTISTPGGVGTPLTWGWEWTWNWACPTTAAPVAQPPPAIELSPPLVSAPPTAADDEPADGAEAPRVLQLVDEDPAATLTTVWLSTGWLSTGWLGLAPELAVVAPFGVDVVVPMPATLEFEAAIPPVVLPLATAPPLQSPAKPFPAADVAAEPTISPPTPRQVRPERIVRQPTASTRYETHVQPRVHHARPVAPERARADNSKRERRELPLERQVSRGGLGSSSAGGIVPSALLFGLAALTGFVVLAAPGLGRRIRVPRTLRPPSPDPSPSEPPG